MLNRPEIAIKLGHGRHTRAGVSNVWQARAGKLVPVSTSDRFALSLYQLFQ
jgi:hypothetical protein